MGRPATALKGGGNSAAVLVVLTLARALPLEDETLVRRAQAGDVSAFEELVRRYQEAAFRAALLVLRDGAEAEDAAQEAFVKAYRALHRFRAGSLRPWLLKIVVNESLNRAKSRRRRTATAERVAAGAEEYDFTLDEAVINRERAQLLRQALEALKERERVVIYLRYFQMLSEQELAEYLGCPAGTVKSRLHRALGKLRDVVSREFPALLGEST